MFANRFSLPWWGWGEEEKERKGDQREKLRIQLKSFILTEHICSVPGTIQSLEEQLRNSCLSNHFSLKWSRMLKNPEDEGPHKTFQVHSVQSGA